jgi:2-C-methyl-D-erythritol 2,4-cyclodiphosphate synthase
MLEARNYQVVNVDVTVVTESPQASAARRRDAAKGSRRAHIGPANVSVKGKSNEGLGWIGRGEGLAVWAVALVDSIPDLAAFTADHGRASTA